MIRSESQPANFQTQFTNGEYVSVSDTTPDKGGGSRGFRPHELLEAALANCMNMTVRMAAQKHAIPLSGVSVAVSLNRNNPDGPLFEYSVEFSDLLSETDKTRLLPPWKATRFAPRCLSRCTLSLQGHEKPSCDPLCVTLSARDFLAAVRQNEGPTPLCILQGA